MAQIVFMGTPDFAVPTLRELIDHHDVIGVVTQPDRPVGRKKTLQPPSIKQVALEAGIPVFQPEKLRQEDAIDELIQWQPDVYVVAAFGQILPQSVLDIPKHGSINVHASLLPRWRGAAPIHAAIKAGDEVTGITIMKIDAGLDTGPILSQSIVTISSDDTGATVHDRLANLGAELLINTLPGYLSGVIQPQPQAEEGVTYAPQIKKEEGQMDWQQTADAIDCHVRAFDPWPGTFTSLKGQTLKIIRGAPGIGKAKQGEVVLHDNKVGIGTSDGLYFPKMVQLAGKKRVTVDEFVRGRPDFIGSRLE